MASRQLSITGRSPPLASRSRRAAPSREALPDHAGAAVLMRRQETVEANLDLAERLWQVRKKVRAAWAIFAALPPPERTRVNAKDGTNLRSLAPCAVKPLSRGWCQLARHNRPSRSRRNPSCPRQITLACVRRCGRRDPGRISGSEGANAISCLCLLSLNDRQPSSQDAPPSWVASGTSTNCPVDTS